MHQYVAFQCTLLLIVSFHLKQIMMTSDKGIILIHKTISKRQL